MEDEYRLFGSDPKAQLATVNQAIYAILRGGQSYRIGTRQLTRADLGLLLDAQSRLEARVEESKPSALLQDTFVVVFDGR